MTKHETSPIHSEPAGTPVRNQESGSSSLARIFWMLIGNVILFFLAMSIYQRHTTLSWFDLAYWIAVLLLVLIRYCDIKYLGGLTAQGQPASIAHWRKYVILLLLIATGVWLVAHGLGFLNK